ncbi:MAG TPA: hypothetical protein DEP42_01955 [Ruminococcaceae bacterium]|nr:hypothetical protein [Oscillospiraceae bacterium]
MYIGIYLFFYALIVIFDLLPFWKKERKGLKTFYVSVLVFTFVMNIWFSTVGKNFSLMGSLTHWCQTVWHCL